jgi:hypothetical protein
MRCCTWASSDLEEIERRLKPAVAHAKSEARGVAAHMEPEDAVANVLLRADLIEAKLTVDLERGEIRLSRPE